MGAMVIDVDAARKDTRGARHVTHLDNAGSSLMPRPVVDTVVAQLRREELIGGYEAAAEATERRESVYSSVARLIGASPNEIAVLESGSTAWSLAVSCLSFSGRRVLLGRSEYWHNVLVLRQLAHRHGLELVVVDDDEHGQLDLGHLERELDRGDVALVALTHVPMGGAQVQPAAEAGRACRAAGVHFVLDACQSVGQLPLDVDALGCDVLVGTGRKFLRGPRGTAFVCIRDRLLGRWNPQRENRAATAGGARALESWETSVAGRLGLGQAVDYALEIGLGPIQDRITALAESMRHRLAELPAVQVHDRGAIRGGIVTFSVQGRTAEEVKTHLIGQQINVSTAPLPPRTAEETLHPTEAKRTLAVRASVHYYNTEEELERLAAALR